MRVAFLTTDNREHFRNYVPQSPIFGTAPDALLRGFASLADDSLIQNSSSKIQNPAPRSEIHVISCTQRRMNSPEKLAANIWFHSLYVPKWGWMRTGYAGCVLATRRLLRNICPDIVHGQGTERDCALSAVLSGYPNILTIHGNMRAVAKKLHAGCLSFHGIAALLEGWCIPRAGGVVCISSYTKNLVEEAAKKVWLVQNAVDPGMFGIPRAPSTQHMLLCVGAVVNYKNQIFLLDVLEGLKTVANFKVVFAGNVSTDDPYGAAFLRRIESLPWAEHRGFQDRNALCQLISEASILVHPSLEDNCPMAILEAMAAGVPCIASRVGGIPDLVIDGRTGFMFNPQSIADARAAIERLLIDPKKRDQMGLNAKAHALAHFHPRIIAGQHLKIYCEVADLRPRAN